MKQVEFSNTPFRAVTAENTFHVLDPVGDFQIGLVLRFAGRIHPELLENALRLSLERVPVLGARFVPGWRTGFWEPSGKNAIVLEKEKTEEADEKAVPAFFATPLDHLTGPLIRARLFRGERDTICLNISHFVADASGVKAYAALLADLYTRLLADPDYIPCSSGLPSRSLRRVFRCFSWRQKGGILRQAFADVLAQPPWPLPYTLPGRASPREKRAYVIRHMDTELFCHLQNWCQRNGATVNDVLMAAFFRAFAVISDSKDGRVPRRRSHRLIVTADLRRYLSPEQAADLICSLSGWVPVTLGRDAGRTMVDTCRRVSALMQRKKQGYLGLGVLSAGAVVLKAAPLSLAAACGKPLAALAAAAGVVAPSFTNMGRLDPAQMDFGGLSLEDAYLVPPVVYPPVFGCGVSGFRDRLTLSAGICEPGFHREDVNALFEQVVQEICALPAEGEDGAAF